METTDQPLRPACGMSIKGGIVKGTVECSNCGVKVEVSVRAIIEYVTEVVG